MNFLNGLLAMEQSTISLIIGFAVLGVIVGLTVIALVMLTRMSHRWIWNWQGHEIVLSMSNRGFELFVDGKLEDVLAAQNVRHCMLKAFIDGQVIKVTLTARRRWEVEASVGGTVLPVQYTGK